VKVGRIASFLFVDGHGTRRAAAQPSAARTSTERPRSPRRLALLAADSANVTTVRTQTVRAQATTSNRPASR